MRLFLYSIAIPIGVMLSPESLVLLGNNPTGTAANPTPLSIPWVLDDYVERLAEAARKRQQP